jgi:hypothetical protein
MKMILCVTSPDFSFDTDAKPMRWQTDYPAHDGIHTHNHVFVVRFLCSSMTTVSLDPKIFYSPLLIEGIAVSILVCLSRPGLRPNT